MEEEKFLSLASSAFSFTEKVEIYRSIDPIFIHQVSSHENYSNIIYGILTEASIAAGDYDILLKILKHSQRLWKHQACVRGYFQALSYNKEAIGILESVLGNVNIHDALIGYLGALKSFPQLITYTECIYDTVKLVYSAAKLNHEIISLRDILMSMDIEIQYYEFLLQTGEYHYSYFKEKLPMTPVLKKWLEITDI